MNTSSMITNGRRVPTLPNSLCVHKVFLSDECEHCKADVLLQRELDAALKLAADRKEERDAARREAHDWETQCETLHSEVLAAIDNGGNPDGEGTAERVRKVVLGLREDAAKWAGLAEQERTQVGKWMTTLQELHRDVLVQISGYGDPSMTTVDRLKAYLAQIDALNYDAASPALEVATKRWRAYEQDYILPCFGWAKEAGYDLEAAVRDNAGRNCVDLLVSWLRADRDRLRGALIELLTAMDAKTEATPGPDREAAIVRVVESIREAQAACGVSTDHADEALARLRAALSPAAPVAEEAIERALGEVHPDPEIAAEVLADRAEGRAVDAAAGVRAGWHRGWSPAAPVAGREEKPAPVCKCCRSKPGTNHGVCETCLDHEPGKYDGIGCGPSTPAEPAAPHPAGTVTLGEISEGLRTAAERALAYDTVLHPNGRCTCGGEGRCAWCVWHDVQQLDERVAKLEKRVGDLEHNETTTHNQIGELTKSVRDIAVGYVGDDENAEHLATRQRILTRHP